MSDAHSPEQFGRYIVTKKPGEYGRKDVYHALVHDASATTKETVWSSNDPADRMNEATARLERALMGGPFSEDEIPTRIVPRPGYYSAAEVQVSHNPTTGHTRYPSPDDYWSGGTTSDPDEASHEGYTDEWARRQAHGKGDDQVPGQIPMFQHGSTHAHSSLDYMATTRSGRAMGMTLMGMAARDTLLEHGHELKPSADLSRHSTRIVHKLADRGVTTAPEFESRNDMDFREEPGYWAGGTESQMRRDAGDPVSSHDVRKGQQFLRSVLKSSRSKPSALGEQQPLFE